MHNIYQYINAGLFLTTWTKEQVEIYKKIIEQFNPIIGKFFGTIIDSNIVEEYLKVDIDYRNDYWSLFENYKVYKRISENVFSRLINLSEVSLYDILRHHTLVQYYGTVVRNKMLKDNLSAKILLDKYEMKHPGEPLQIYLPNELTNADKELIIHNYIKSEDANLNLLEVIQNLQSTAEFSISDRTKLMAKRQAEVERRKYFKDNTGICMQTKIMFSESQNEAVLEKIDGHNWEFTYSSAWINENNDYSTLLNNFIYLFNFADMQMRITFVHKMSEMSVLERELFIRSRHAYPTGVVFQRMNTLAYLQLTAYYQELLREKIRLEEIIEWFFKNYMQKEFAISDFSIQMPSADSLYLEKCRAIFPEMESVLKQYKLFVEDGYVDKELLRISSGHLCYENIPSLLEKKYVYGVGKEYETIKYYLSSDQCMLSYVERIGEHYDNFYDLITHEKISVNDYREFNQSDIEWLTKHNIICLDKDGFIHWKNINSVTILMDLCRNDVINYWSYPEKCRVEFDSLQASGIIEFSNTLFSRPEQDYINYMLNKSKYNNGLDIRNRYEHGTQPDSDSDEKIHEQYYMYALLIFVICIIKINDELCIWDSLKKTKNYDRFLDYYDKK